MTILRLIKSHFTNANYIVKKFKGAYHGISTIKNNWTAGQSRRDLHFIREHPNGAQGILIKPLRPRKSLALLHLRWKFENQ
jgi:hypothetical protein